MNRLNKTESAVFLYFMKDVFQIILRLHELCLCHLELVNLLTVHRYSVDILSYSGLSRILGSNG